MSITGIVLCMLALGIFLFIIWAFCRVAQICDEESEIHDP
jgi:hypothetical protein